MFASELQNLARACHVAADGLVAKGRQPFRQARRDEIEVIFAQPRGVAHPDGVHFLQHLIERPRHLHAGENLGEGNPDLRISIVVVRDARVGKGQLIEVELRVAQIIAEQPMPVGVMLLERIEIADRMQPLREMPDVAVARLRLAFDGGGDHADAEGLLRRLGGDEIVNRARTRERQRAECAGGFQSVASGEG